MENGLPWMKAESWLKDKSSTLRAAEKTRGRTLENVTNTKNKHHKYATAKHLSLSMDQLLRFGEKKEMSRKK